MIKGGFSGDTGNSAKLAEVSPQKNSDRVSRDSALNGSEPAQIASGSGSSSLDLARHVVAGKDKARQTPVDDEETPLLKVSGDLEGVKPKKTGASNSAQGFDAVRNSASSSPTKDAVITGGQLEQDSLETDGAKASSGLSWAYGSALRLLGLKKSSENDGWVDVRGGTVSGQEGNEQAEGLQLQQQEGEDFVKVSSGPDDNDPLLDNKIQMYSKNDIQGIVRDKRPHLVYRAVFGNTRQASLLDETRVREVIKKAQYDQIKQNLNIYEDVCKKVDDRYKVPMEALQVKVGEYEKRIEVLEGEIDLCKGKNIETYKNIIQGEVDIVELEYEGGEDKKEVKGESKEDTNKIEGIEGRALKDKRMQLQKQKKFLEGQEKLIERQEKILEDLKQRLEALRKQLKELEDQKVTAVEKLFSAQASVNLEAFKTDLQRVAAEHDFHISDRGLGGKPPKLVLGLRHGGSLW